MTQWIADLMPHLMLAPILLPMLTAALMLFLREERQRLKLAMNLLSTLLGLGICAYLMRWTSSPASMAVYIPGNWPAPFGIALALVLAEPPTAELVDEVATRQAMIDDPGTRPAQRAGREAGSVLER